MPPILRALVLGFLAPAAVLAVSPVLPALAHHGWGSYDSGTTVTLDGAVERVSWGNPHVTIWLQHQGKPVEVVLAPPSRMQGRGLPEADLRPGLPVSLDAYPNRDDPAEFRAERIRVGGKTVELR
ncbi:DUF6152 family protein [Oleisolibacter albus]|uniref:DUF6152 family protein n=1 Tax=Oleisolibacter albus TaxID=2171757 RepID=UPI001874557E|nr:DUF6152 family protein [Oleisolibacter albus]